MGLEYIPPPVRPRPPAAMTELEAIALGAPSPADLEAWISSDDGRTLWEFVIDKRRWPGPAFPADPGVILLR